MKIISLTLGKYALVDDCDFDKVKNKTWYAKKYTNTYYAARDGGYHDDGRQKQNLRMHWLIVGKPEKGFVVDHINGNGLDNRRCNLRIVSNQQNLRNKHENPRGAVRYYGVAMARANRPRRYRAVVCIPDPASKRKQRVMALGSFYTAEDAALAFDLWCVENQPDARLNFPELFR